MSVSGIDNMITDFINSITYEALNKLQIPNMSTQDTIDKGVVLRKTVFDRLKSVIGDRKIIFLAQDGDLSRLPFEILATSDDGRHFLLDDDYDISYLSTSRDILRFDTSGSGSVSDPLVAVDPDYDLTSIIRASTTTETSQMKETDKQLRESDLELTKIHFPNLSNTLVEGELIGDILNVRAWTGDDVPESRIKACKSPGILHIATHGFFLSNKPNNTSKVEEMNPVVIRIGSKRANKGI